MRRHRLDRLTRLTQGATLVTLGVGLGALAAGCNNEPKAVNSPDPKEPIHVNATADPPASGSAAPTTMNAPDPTPTTTATPTATATATTTQAPTASASARTHRPPTINAPPHVNAPFNAPKPD
jgi:hypothetical protein